MMNRLNLGFYSHININRSSTIIPLTCEKKLRRFLLKLCTRNMRMNLIGSCASSKHAGLFQPKFGSNMDKPKMLG